MLAQKNNLGNDIYDHDKRTELYLSLAEQEIKKSPKTLIDEVNELDFMMFTLEDYQIVLANSIPSDRIVKIIPQGDEFGRIQRLRKRSTQ